jgi:1-acyl-sn-glycerol-3-phosphate acyltransferase
MKLSEKQKYSIVNLFLRALAVPFVRIFWLKKTYGFENIPKEGPAIIVANHESYLDFVCLCSVFPMPLHFLAAEVFFKKRKWRWLMKLTGQIKVERYGENKKESARLAIKEAVRILSDKGMLGIFPEGTRSSDGKLQKAFNGAAKIALLSRSSVIPVGISGTFEIMSRHDKLPKLRRCCVLKIGKPLYFSEYYGKENNEFVLTEITRKIMKEIALLANEEYSF